MPIPEGLHVPNPTIAETDRETRVRFTRAYAYAYGGINVVRYHKDQVADVSAQCAEIACGEGAAAMADGENVFDPSKGQRAPVRAGAPAKR